MDKRSVLAIALITVIIIFLPSYYDMIGDGESSTPVSNNQENQVDQLQTKSEVIKQSEKPTEIAKVSTESISEEEKPVFIPAEPTPLVEAKISSKGGGNFINWKLMEYDTWEEKKVSIINEEFQNGLKMSFQIEEGNYIDLNQYNFNVENSGQEYILTPDDKISLRFVLNIKESTIEKIYTFYGNAYHIDVQIKISNAQSLLLNNEYQFGWTNGLPSNEINVVEDYTYSEAYASMGGELETYELDSEGAAESKDYNGNIDWVGLRMKYFLAAVVPDNVKTTGVSFSGRGEKTDKTVLRKYNTYINTEIETNDISHGYQVYMGPMDYSVLSEYDNSIDELIMNHGWYETTFRPISLFIFFLALLCFFC